MDQPSHRERFLKATARIDLISKRNSYFLSQNAAIAAGTTSGISLNLQVLGVGDGLTVC